jgi:hypothetical protein
MITASAENVDIMLKNNLKYSVAEAARLLEVDNDTIKDWCYHFSDYSRCPKFATSD